MPTWSHAALFAAFPLALWLKLVIIGRSLSCCGAFPEHVHPLSATAAILLLMTAVVVRLAPVARLAGWLIAASVLTTIALADLVYFRFFGDLLSVYEAAAAWQLSMVHASVITALRWSDLLYWADVVLGLSVVALLRRRRVTGQDAGARAGRRAQAALVVLGILLLLPSLRLVARDPDGVFEYTIGRRQVVAAIGLVGYHLHDAAAFVVRDARDRRAVGETGRQRVRESFTARQAARHPPSPLAGVATGRNLIVVQVESLQAFAVGLTIEGRDVTPRLSQFARESLHFTRFFDQTYGGATSDAIFSSLQSLHPLPVGAVATRYPAIPYRGLPAVLGAAGYDTLAATGTRGEFWNLRLLLPALGFGRSLFPEHLEPGETFGQGLSDADVFRQMPRRLDGLREPFFGFIASVSSHHPFRDGPRNPPPFELGALRGTELGGYLALVHYFDRAFGTLLDGLRESGRLDRSIIVVYGDHEAFLEQTPALHRHAGIASDDGFARWRLRHRLPLMVRLPNGAHAGEHTVTAGHLDIAPTLLSLLGVTDRGSVMLGRDLTTGEEQPVVFRNGGVATRDGYAIVADEGQTCYRGSAVTDCVALAGEQRAAVERLELSDLTLRGGIPWPLPAGPALIRARLETLAPAHGEAPQSGAGTPLVGGDDFVSPAPSGSSFVIDTARRHVNVAFTPFLDAPARESGPGGVLFQVLGDGALLFERLLRPGEASGPVVMPIADGSRQQVVLTFVTTPGGQGAGGGYPSVWKDVAIIVERP